MSFHAGHGAASPPLPDDPDVPSDDDGHKRQRISRACDRCRRKKVKCNGLQPTCTHCAAIGATCTYLDTAKKRGPPKGYIDAIESRLHATERLLRELVLGDPATARFVVDTLQAPGGVSAAALRDSTGRLFGCLTLDDLKTCATPATAAAKTQRSGSSGDWASPLSSLERGVGHLTLDQTGSLRYLGGSSGWDIVNRSLHASKDSPQLARSGEGALRWPPISSNTPRDAESADAATAASSLRTSASGDDYSPRRRMDIDGGASRARAGRNSEGSCGGASAGAWPWSSGDHSGGGVAVPRNMPPSGKPPMPTRDEQMRMLSLYFQHVHPVFPILYKSHFLARALDRTQPGVPALMSAVFAAASTYLVREARTKGDLAQVRMQMYTHFQRAKMYLEEQYTCNTIASIQTLLLMSIYEQGTMSTRSWLYSGMAIRKAYDLGLHRDVGLPRHGGLAAISQPDTQIRQRAWWGCYVMDIMVSATLGRPTTIRDFTFDTPYPDDYGGDDDELLVNLPAAAAPAEKRRAHGAYYLDLLHIFGHILTEMYTCKPHSSYVARFCLQDLHSQTDQLVLLDNELREWAAALPPELQYPIDDMLAARPARCVYVALLHLVYNTAMILLHRPFIARIDAPPAADARGGSGSPSPLPSHSICTMSAQMISQIGQAFVRDSQVVIMPFLTFMMFTAGTMHLNNILVSADGATARRFLKRTLDVMSCLGAHWQVSYKCYTMLNTLVRTNRIVFDPVVDSTEAELQAIKSRAQVVAQVARDVHDSWLQQRAHHHRPHPRRASGSAPAFELGPGGDAAGPGASDGARPADTVPVSGDWQRLDHEQPAHLADPWRSRGNGSSSSTDLVRDYGRPIAPMSAGPGGEWQDRPLWARRNTDNSGHMTMPATPLAYIMSPDPVGARLPRPLSAGRSNSFGVNSLPLSSPPANGATLQALAGVLGSPAGQFVPSLEIFANPDYPLGIGRLNGMAPTAQPLAQGTGDGLEQLAGLLGDLEANPYPGGLGLHLLGTEHPGDGDAATNAALQPARASESDIDVWSQLHAGSAAGSRAPTPALAFGGRPTAPPSAGFDTAGPTTSDDILRDLLRSGPVSFDLSELASRAGHLAGDPSSDTQRPEYLGQLFRMLGGSSNAPPPQP